MLNTTIVWYDTVIREMVSQRCLPPGVHFSALSELAATGARYEATEYGSASFARILKVVQALGLSLPKAVRLVRNP
jgi:hypothetical protein